MLLLIRNHPLYFAEIAIAHQRGRAQLAFALLGLGAQHVTQAGMPALHLAVGRQLKALGRALVRFQFRHKSSESAASRLFPAASFNLQNLSIALESIGRLAQVLGEHSIRPSLKPA